MYNVGNMLHDKVLDNLRIAAEKQLAKGAVLDWANPSGPCAWDHAKEEYGHTTGSERYHTKRYVINDNKGKIAKDKYIIDTRTGYIRLLKDYVNKEENLTHNSRKHTTGYRRNLGDKAWECTFYLDDSLRYSRNEKGGKPSLELYNNSFNINNVPKPARATIEKVLDESFPLIDLDKDKYLKRETLTVCPDTKTFKKFERPFGSKFWECTSYYDNTIRFNKGSMSILNQPELTLKKNFDIEKIAPAARKTIAEAIAKNFPKSEACNKNLMKYVDKPSLKLKYNIAKLTKLISKFVK